MILNLKYTIFIFLLSICLIGNAKAGVFGDNLGKCLVRSSTDADKQHLMEWIFSVISLNSAIAQYTNIPDEKRIYINKNMANLVEKLVGETCKIETNEALKNEGSSALGAAFKILAEVATNQLFGSTEVSEGSKSFLEFIDMEKLQ